MRAAFRKYGQTYAVTRVLQKTTYGWKLSEDQPKTALLRRSNVCPKILAHESTYELRTKHYCAPPIYIFAKASAETRTTQNSTEECMESHLLAALQAHPVKSQWKPSRYRNDHLSTPLCANLPGHRGVAHRHKASPC